MFCPRKICKLKQYYNFIHTSTKINILFPILFSISTPLHQVISLPTTALYAARYTQPTPSAWSLFHTCLPNEANRGSAPSTLGLRPLSLVFIIPHRTHQSYFLFFLTGLVTSARRLTHIQTIQQTRLTHQFVKQTLLPDELSWTVKLSHLALVQDDDAIAV